MDMETVEHDHSVVLRGVSWEQYEALSETRLGKSQPRMFYLDGELELMASSPEHEYIRVTLSRCLEVATELLGIDLHGYRSTTRKRKRRRAAAEPDEQYYVRKRRRRRPPDLAIEVVWTNPAIDKLAIYERLGVREVWIWEDDELTAHVYERGRWNPRRFSRVLPELDLELLERCVRTDDQPKALRMLRRALKRH